MTDDQVTATVVIVDDDEAIRDSLSRCMRAAGFEVRCHESGHDFFEHGEPKGPACLLLDLKMPGPDGMAVHRRIREEDWQMPVIFLTGHGEVPQAVEALKSGAADFFQKPVDPARLVARVRAVIEEHRKQLERFVESEGFRRQVEMLSRRELEVARLVAAGLTNRAVGEELGISERTVEVHRGRAMKKLGLHNVADLVRLEDYLGEPGQEN